MVSIDIGNRNIHIIEGRQTAKGMEIRNMVVMPTPVNTVSDGRIDDPVPLRMAINDILRDKGFRSKNAVITIQSNSVVSREFVLPRPAKEYIGNVVAFEMGQFLPPSQNGGYNVQYKVLDEFESDGVKKIKVRVAAMPKMIAGEYFAFVKSLGLRPIALDMHANCISKLFCRNLQINDVQLGLDMNIAIIDIGYRNTGINIISQGHLEFSRYLSSGVREVDAAISSHFGISIEKAEQVKIKKLNLETDESSYDTGSETLKAVQGLISSWTGEIQKVIQYFSLKNSDNKVNMVFLCGGGANLAGLPAYLEKLLELPVRKIESMSNVAFKGSKDTMSIEYIINTIGALIRF